MRLLGYMIASMLFFDIATATEDILLIAGKKSHGWNEHDHPAGCDVLSKALNESGLGLKAVVHKDSWPSVDVLKGRKAIVIYSDGFGEHIASGHEKELKELSASGAGIVFLHYATAESTPAMKDALMTCLGGCYSADWSVNPIWTMTNSTLARHPSANGVGPINIKDEFYYHIKFGDGLKGVTPVLSALPPADSVSQDDKPNIGNPSVRREIAEGKLQTIAWAYEASGGIKGFGFTGGHYHTNWMNDDYRKLVLNAIVWAAGLPVPENGVQSKTPSIVINKLITQSIAKNDAADVQQHIRSGADVNEQNPSGWAPLHYAAVRGNKAIAGLLIESGAKLDLKTKSNQTVLHFAADRGFAELTELLVDKGADINAADKDGWTPLHFAAVKDRIAIAGYLIKKGAGVNNVSVGGGTPLHEASASASAEMIKLLLDNGADKSIKAKNGKTALDYAVELKNEAAEKLLK